MSDSAEKDAARARPDLFTPSARWVDRTLRCPADCRLRARGVDHVHHGPPNNRVTLKGAIPPGVDDQP